jgi:hypothetical protein
MCECRNVVYGTRRPPCLKLVGVLILRVRRSWLTLAVLSPGEMVILADPSALPRNQPRNALYALGCVFTGSVSRVWSTVYTCIRGYCELPTSTASHISSLPEPYTTYSITRIVPSVTSKCILFSSSLQNQKLSRLASAACIQYQ